MCRSLSAVVTICLFSVLAFGSSIVPYNNLEHLSTSSDLIVIAKASSEKSLTIDGITTFHRNFQIQDYIKGYNGQAINITSGKKVVGEYTNLIHGEFDFHTGDTYLLFLQEQADGSYYPICLSYYVFQEIQKKGQSYLVPAYEENSLQVLKNKKEQILTVYNKDLFVEELRAFSKNHTNIDFSKIVADQENQTLTQAIKKLAPAHCTYLRTNNGRRFQVRDLASQSLPIYYQNGQNECATVNSEMQSAVQHMNDNYDGISIQLAGTSSGYTPNCAGGNAFNISFFGGNYDEFMDQQFGTSRAVLVQFGDPCNEIPALNNCSGTVAFGGSWAIGSHTANGETFNTAVNGYVIVNEGMGSCNCGDVSSGSPVSDFSAIIAHELSHTVGLNHIESNFGSANMNPISGSQITNLDVQCMDDLYPPSTETTSGPDDENTPPVDDTPPAGEADLVSINCGVITQSDSSVSYNGLRVRNSGEANSQATRIAYYLSSDNTITTNDRLIGTATLPALAVGANTAINSSFSIAGIPDGSYTIGVIIDDNNTVNESNESNNSCFIQNQNVVISTAPPSQADLVSINCGVITQSATSVSYNGLRVRNSGEANSQATRIGYYLSSDNTITTNDRLLGTASLPALAVGANSAINNSFSIEGIPDGSYTIGVIIDDINAVSESNESNNSCFLQNQNVVISTAPLGQPDLVSVNCGVISQNGTTVSYSGLRIRNSGEVNSQATRLAYYLSSDNTITSNDQLVGTASIPALVVGATTAINNSFSIAGIPDGSYTIGVIIDDTNTVSESNENNNTCIIQDPNVVISTAPPGQPDLAFNICGRVSLQTNRIAINNLRVENAGNAAATGTIRIDFYASLDQTITTRDHLVSSQTINGLSAGAIETINTTMPIPDLPDGNYVIGILLDSNNAVTESDESNNSCFDNNPRLIIETETPLADLSISCGSLSVTGTTARLTEATIRNIGSTFSPAGIQATISLTNGENQTTILTRSLPALVVDDSYNLNHNFSIANLDEGTYNVTLTVDGVNILEEENERNNTCTISNPAIVIEPEEELIADLDITTCGAVSQSGNELTISNAIVRNIGTGPTDAQFFLGYYLSADNQINTDDVYLGFDFINTLDANAQSVESATFDLNNYDLEDGEYIVGLIADFNSRVTESNESNNTCRRVNPRIVIGEEPEPEQVTDLTVTCGSITQSTNSISLSNAFVTNSGNKAITEGFFVGLYLSEDQTITTDDYLIELGQDFVPNLGIGNRDPLNGNYSLNGIPPGDYYFGIIADHSSDIAEDNERNNTCVNADMQITIGAATSNSPDLIATCDEAIVLTNELSVTNMTVQNRGNTSSGSYSFVGFYISADQEITTDDHYLGYDFAGTLDQGETSTESESFDISDLPLPDGNYFLGAIADFSERITESNESNNACVFSGVRIQLGDSGQTGGGSSAPVSDDCENLSLTTFENGQLAPWVDGGAHAFINSGSTYAATGQRSFALRGDAGPQSSIFMNDFINTNATSSYRLSFNVLTYLVERGDNLLVEIDTGNGFTELQKFEANVDFDPSTNHAVSIDFNAANRFKLRIRSNTSHTYEYIFIDDIKIQECPSTGILTTASTETRSASAQATIEVQQKQRLDVKLSPNPISLYGTLTVEIENEYSDGQLNIYDSAGALRQSNQLVGNKTSIPISSLTNGLYYVSIIADDQHQTQKLIIAN